MPSAAAQPIGACAHAHCGGLALGRAQVPVTGYHYQPVLPMRATVWETVGPECPKRSAIRAQRCNALYQLVYRLEIHLSGINQITTVPPLLGLSDTTL